MINGIVCLQQLSPGVYHDQLEIFKHALADVSRSQRLRPERIFGRSI